VITDTGIDKCKDFFAFGIVVIVCSDFVDLFVIVAYGG